MIDLSIIITTWNARTVLMDCLATLPAACPRHAPEVLVVDNASTDGTSEAVQAYAYPIRLLRVEENRGFAAGNNVGLRASQGRYVILLNSDTQVPAQALDQLIDFMDAHSTAGACGPRLEHPGQKTQPFAYGNDPGLMYLLRRGFTRLAFKRALHDWETARTLRVDWVAGTALVARRAAIEQVGLMDEQFYAYFEDNDWCRRMRLAHWEVYYYPAVTIRHLGGYSLRKDPAARAAYFNSLLHFYAKHYPRWQHTLLRHAWAVYQRVST